VISARKAQHTSFPLAISVCMSGYRSQYPVPEGLRSLGHVLPDLVRRVDPEVLNGMPTSSAQLNDVILYLHLAFRSLSE
jgi:hypothetical protein